MKTLKKLFCTMFSAVLAATLIAAPAYAESGQYVFDECGVLTSSQVAELDAIGASYAQQYGIGVYWLFTDTMNGMYDPTNSQRNEFARQYFLQNNLGVGTNQNGIIAVVAVRSRDYVTVKHFADSGEDPFSNACVDALESDYTSYLSNNNWYGGAAAYYDTVGEQMAYFAVNGKQWTEPDPLGLIIKILVTLGIPALVARSIVQGDKQSMLTAREKGEAGDYLDRDSLRLSSSTDDLVNTTMSVVPIPHDDGKHGGGGGWSDMGGGFSGSGGGKF